MKVAIGTGEGDLDKIVAQCKAADVQNVCVNYRAILDAQGQSDAKAVAALKAKLEERGIALSAMVGPWPSEAAVRKYPDNRNEVKDICKLIEATGLGGVPTMLMYPWSAFRIRDPSKPIQLIDASKPPQLVPGGDNWPSVVSFFQDLADSAEKSGVRMAYHIWDVKIMDAIIEAVPSPFNGVTYCPGMYIIGEDPYKAILHWGKERIFQAHARNFIKHGNLFKDYEEVLLDRGEIDIPRCLALLKKVGYEGIIVPEHLGRPDRIPEAVRYLKQHLQN